MVPTFCKYWRNGGKHFLLDDIVCFIDLWNHHTSLYDNFEYILLGYFQKCTHFGDFICVNLCYDYEYENLKIQLNITY